MAALRAVIDELATGRLALSASRLARRSSDTSDGLTRGLSFVPVIIRLMPRKRPEWHHHMAKAVEYGLTKIRTRLSILFTLGLQGRRIHRNWPGM